MTLFLIAASLSRETRKKYRSALNRFLTWYNKKFPENEHNSILSFEALDHVLTSFYHDMYEERPTRGCRQMCINARSAILICLPDAKYRLPMSQRCEKGWDRIMPGKQTPPLPFPLALLLARSYLRTNELQMATITLLSFYGLFRINELLSLKWCDVSFPSRLFIGGFRLAKTKTGLNQSVLSLEHVTWTLLSRLYETRGSSPKVFTLTYKRVAKSFTRSLSSYGLTHHLYTLHSLRQGGATYLHLKGMSVKDISVYGRWVSIKTCARYLQAGRALLLIQQIPPRYMDICTSLSENPLSLFDHLR